MAISGISSRSTQDYSSSSSSSELSKEQSKKLDDILSRYDAKKMSETDVTNLKTELKNSGIRPGEAVKSKLDKSGFDSEMFRPADSEESSQSGSSLRMRPGMSGRPGPGGAGRPGGPGGAGGPGRAGGPGPEKTGNESSEEKTSSMLNIEVLKPLKQTLQQYDLNNLTSDDQVSLLENLRSKGIFQTGLIIDLSA